MQWIKDEREQLAQLVEQDVEEFSYSARNELEWLNEHMADIFSKNQMYVSVNGRHEATKSSDLETGMSQMFSRLLESYEARLRALHKTRMLNVP